METGWIQFHKKNNQNINFIMEEEEEEEEC
jgi:hypothetical protein